MKQARVVPAFDQGEQRRTGLGPAPPRPRLIASHSRLAKKLSAMALSSALPTLPMPGRTPSRRSASFIDTAHRTFLAVDQRLEPLSSCPAKAGTLAASATLKREGSIQSPDLAVREGPSQNPRRSNLSTTGGQLRSIASCLSASSARRGSWMRLPTRACASMQHSPIPAQRHDAQGQLRGADQPGNSFPFRAKRPSVP